MSLEKNMTALYKDNNLQPLDYIEVLTDVGRIRDKWKESKKK